MTKINDYEIYNDRLLGEGSFSFVYLGRYIGQHKKNIKNNTTVAIKILKSSKLIIMPKIKDEIKIMKIIKNDPHPNIVGCHDIIEKNDMIYIILEYCDSGNLKDIIRRPIKEKYVQFYFSQLKNGLKYLEKYNILHRDIKPKNILLTNNKKILKIADFGFSTEHSNNILHETICGSPLYMAPEIIEKTAYNNQIDLWSIGMILYEMLYGEHPFEECRSITELRNLINKNIKIPPSDNLNMDISNECISLLKKLLQKDVNIRINWGDFFDHPWLNVFDTTSKSPSKMDEYQKQICSTSIGSLNIEIIHDYCDKINDLEKTAKFNNADSFCSTTELDKDSDDHIFDIEIDQQENITIKKLKNTQNTI
jgi:serine/threonine protein kinase